MKTKLEKLAPSAAPGPDFIGVGPEKTGTTWIDSQLRAHPDVNLPPVKELRYFWEKAAFPGETFWRRINAKESWHRQQYVDYALLRLKAIARNPVRNVLFERGRLAWDMRYVLSAHDDRWYLSCFKNEPDKISGEISPQYFFCSLPQVQAIQKLLPDCKVIVTLRRPVDWVWSFAKMNIQNGALKTDMIEHFIDAKIASCSFSKSLSYWRQCYPDDRLLVLFYENLNNNPWQYYKDICTFLNISPDHGRRQQVSRRVNAGNREPLPERLVAKIQNGWRDDVRALSNMVSMMPASWRE